MPVTITSRPANADDDNRIGNRLTQFTLDRGGPDYKPLTFVFQAHADGQIVGELLATELWGQMEINLLHVLDEYRGRGIGGELLTALETMAKERECKGVSLWTPTWQGEGFYERQGYAAVARFPLNTKGHFNDAPTEHIIYYKSLAP